MAKAKKTPNITDDNQPASSGSVSSNAGGKNKKAITSDSSPSKAPSNTKGLEAKKKQASKLKPSKKKQSEKAKAKAKEKAKAKRAKTRAKNKAAKAKIEAKEKAKAERVKNPRKVSNYSRIAKQFWALAADKMKGKSYAEKRAMLKTIYANYKALAPEAQVLSSDELVSALVESLIEDFTLIKLPDGDLYYYLQDQLLTLMANNPKAKQIRFSLIADDRGAYGSDFSVSDFDVEDFYDHVKTHSELTDYIRANYPSPPPDYELESRDGNISATYIIKAFTPLGDKPSEERYKLSEKGRLKMERRAKKLEARRINQASQKTYIENMKSGVTDKSGNPIINTDAIKEVEIENAKTKAKEADKALIEKQIELEKAKAEAEKARAASLDKELEIESKKTRTMAMQLLSEGKIDQATFLKLIS